MIKKNNYVPCRICQKPISNATGLCSPCRWEISKREKDRKKRLGIFISGESKLQRKKESEVRKYLK